MSGSRLALIVANADYADAGLRRLAAPSRDAEALAEVLGDHGIGGFDVSVLHDATAQALRVAVEDFFADRRPEDLLVLHFSCHGLKNAGGELYLAAADTRPDRLASTAVAADFVNRQMAESRAQRIALFLDCCYGGAFPRGMVVRSAGQAQVKEAFEGQERVGGGKGRVVVTASSAVEYAFEGEQLAAGATSRPSVFTAAVVDGLTTGEADRDGDGWVGLGELFSYVTDRVRRDTPHQSPQMWTFGAQGDLLIARSRQRRLVATPLSAELLEATKSPLPAIRYGMVDELRNRLLAEDLGQALTAYQILQSLLDDDSRRVSAAAADAIAAAGLGISPAVIDFGTYRLGDAAPTRTVDVTGPTLAAAVAVTATESWLRVDQEERTIRITLAATEPGPLEGAVLLTGPTGQQPIKVRADVLPVPAASVPSPAPVAAPPPPAVESAPHPPVASAPQPPVASAQQPPVATGRPPSEQAPPLQPQPARALPPEPKPQTEQSASTTPPPRSTGGPEPRREPVAAIAGADRQQRIVWLVAATFAVGGILLAVINWPGQPTEYLYCECSTVQVLSGPLDGYLVAALVIVAGAVVALSRPLLGLGAAVGAAGYLLVQGMSIIGTRIVAEIPEEQTAWWQTVAITLVLLVIAGLAITGLQVWRRPVIGPPGLSIVLLVAGSVAIFVAYFVPLIEDISLVEAQGLWAALPDLFVIAVCVLLAIARLSPQLGQLAYTAVATWLALSVLSSLYLVQELPDAPTPVWAGWGDALLLAFVVIRALESARRHPEPLDGSTQA